jgi:hypothetical protein
VRGVDSSIHCDAFYSIEDQKASMFKVVNKTLSESGCCSIHAVRDTSRMFMISCFPESLYIYVSS